MITKRVPGQLANEQVILMKIVPKMGEDKIGRESFLEALENLFDRRANVREEAVPERLDDDSFVARAIEEGPGAALGFASAVRIRAKNEPVEFDFVGALEQPENRATATDLN